MPIPGLRSGPRPRTSDDDDWGTSSPAAIMNPPELPSSHSSNLNVTPAVARLKQQDLKSYTCTFSPRCIVSLYFVIAIVFIPLGTAVIVATASIKSTRGRIRYDSICQQHDSVRPSDHNKSLCVISFNVSDTIPAPSYLYYSLSNFYQNSRKYAKSRSDIMNQGRTPSNLLEVETCEPSLYREGRENTTSFNASDFLYPCGLTARSFFNDTFEVCRDKNCNEFLNVTKDGIAWWTDTQYKFNKGNGPLFTEPIDGEPIANNLLDDDDFVVWMRLSAFPRFDKLYRIIRDPLEPGRQYYMRIRNIYPVDSFGGSKSFYITTTSWIGGPNPFLGTAYLIVGVIALFIAVIVLFRHLLNPRSTSTRDPSMLLREHLEKYVLEPEPLHS